MECIECGAELPPGTGDEPCPDCGFEIRPLGGRRQEPVPLPGAWGFLPGIGFAVLVGFLNWAVFHVAELEMGFALYVGLPMAVGTMLGYTVTVRGALKGIFIAVAAVVALVLLGGMFGFTGMFCAVVLSAVFLAPVLFGILLGSLLRHVVAHFVKVVILLALLPAAGGLLETALRDGPVTIEVSTLRSVEAPASVVFANVVFFEEGDADPPWIFRLGLPRPLRAEGAKAAVGDETTCVYSRGHLKKRITERVAKVGGAHRLAFVVTEQHLHFERDLRLLGGSIEVSPGPGGTSMLRLTTRYEGLTGPDWLWRPMEAWCLQELHDHVIDEISRRAVEASSVASR